MHQGTGTEESGTASQGNLVLNAGGPSKTPTFPFRKKISKAVDSKCIILLF